MNIRDTNNFDSTNMSSMRVSKKIDLSRISRKGIDPGAVTYMTPDARIQKLDIQKCVCSLFVPSEQNKTRKILCGCGRFEEMHSQDALAAHRTLLKEGKLPDKWNYKEHTSDVSSFDFGEVNFTINKKTNSKFIRVSHRTSTDKLIDLLTNCWKLKPPELIISITGGAKGMQMNEKLRKLLRMALVKTALNSNTWIITAGTNEGIAKDVGQAVRENVSTLDAKKQIVLLGIANWTSIRNTHCLERGNPNESKNIFYYDNIKNDSHNEQKLKNSHALLDPNHTHFILVDNQELNKYGGETDLRSKLESALYEESTDKDKIASVLLVVNGGIVSIKTVNESVKKGLPCIFIENSGRCANIFVHIYKLIRKNLSAITLTKNMLQQQILYTMDQNDNKKGLVNELVSVEVDKQLEIYFPELKTKHKEMSEQIMEVFDYMHLLSIFDVDYTKYEANRELDSAILYSFLKSQGIKDTEKDIHSITEAQLNLASKWKRIDIAERYILRDKKWPTKFFDKLAYDAIKFNRPEFLRAFLDHGLVLSKFLTHRRLLKLYNDISKDSVLYSCLEKNKIFDNFFKDKFNTLIRKIKRLPIENVDEMYFGFPEIGKVIEQNLDNFFYSKFSRFPFSSISKKKYKTILQQTDSYGKCNRLTSSLYLTIEWIDFEAPVENPENELFIYSVLTNKPEIAKLCIKEGRAEMSCALVASKIFQSYSRINANQNDNSDFEKLSNKFEMLAYNMMQTAYDQDKHKAMMLLMKEIPEFGNSTCLQLAKLASNLNFLGHKCVQELLANIWYDKLSNETPYHRIFFCLVLPFLAPFLCTYNEMKTQGSNETTDEEYAPVIYNDIKGSSKDSTQDSRTINRINLNQRQKKLGHGKKIYYFLNAPIVKFFYDKISLILFLILFSYVLLCDFFPFADGFSKTTTFNTPISISELILTIWAVTFMIQKIHDLRAIDSYRIRSRLTLFFRNNWNTIEVFACLGFIIGIILRFIPNNHNCYIASRVILSIDIIVWYLKTLHVLTFIKELGPKLVMMIRMTSELLSFMFIIILFMFAFGISTQSMMYHNQSLDWDLLKNVFFPAYFVIGGEYLKADTLLGASTCKSPDESRYGIIQNTDVYTQEDCPEINGAGVSLTLFTFYLIILNILLTNLLIAIFSKTFDSIENESDNVWKLQMYTLIYEYFHKPILPPPINVLIFLTYPITLLARLLKATCLTELIPSENTLNKLFFHFYQRYNRGFKIYFETAGEKLKYVIWESKIAEESLISEKRKEEETMEFKLNRNYRKLIELERQLSIVYEKRLKNVSDLDKIDRALDKILAELSLNEKPDSLVNIDKNKAKDILKKILQETFAKQ